MHLKSIYSFFNLVSSCKASSKFTTFKTSHSADSEWEDLVAIVVEWLQTSPNINMDIMLALWLDTDGCNLMNSFKVSLFVLIMTTTF